MRHYQYFEEVNPALLRLVPRATRVLDVGCGFGALGEQLKNRGCYVVGLDVSEYAVESARQRIDEAYVCDITNPGPLPVEGSAPFDVIAFGDVLEHLSDPGPALKRFSRHLAPHGRVIVSLPNVVSWPIRIGLLFGRFRYTETGILDRTHLRFFTFKTAREMIQEAGFDVKAVAVTPNFVRVLLPIVRKWFLGTGDRPADPKAIVNSRSYRAYIKWVFPVETLIARLWPGLFAFQFVFCAAPGPPTDSRTRG